MSRRSWSLETESRLVEKIGKLEGDSWRVWGFFRG